MYLSSAKALSKPIPASTFLGDLDDFYECCGHQAWFYEEGWISLHIGVDNLQALAELWGLVDLHGQDEIQTVMANAFYPEPVALSFDYAAQIVRQWEIADPRDRWKHTDEAAPSAASDSLPTPQPYRTPQSSIDAFWCVVEKDDADYLAGWLLQHPRDAATLHKLWEAKHALA